MREYDSLQSLQRYVGQEIGTSEWVTIDQKSIDLFAELTGDNQWIHVDTKRAADGPYGGTIAHGLLTLGFIPAMETEAIRIKNVKIGVNYGFNKVRFISPLKVNSRVRGRFKLVSMEPLPPLNGEAGFEIITDATIECEGSTKPVCVAQRIFRRYG